MAALLLALASTDAGWAATAYVTDELVLGVYAQQSTSGLRLATLHSGASVETLAISGDATQVQLADGITGWVKSAYLTTAEPATVRLKQLQEDLDRSKATTPLPAETARRNEVARLQREVAQQAEAAATRGTIPAVGPAAAAPTHAQAWTWGLSVLLSMGAGFWLGYATLARRLKLKFGGIKVY